MTLKTFIFSKYIKVKIPNNSIFGYGSVKPRKVIGTPLMIEPCTHMIGVYRYY
jgi:hypothetical protein